MVQLDEGLQTTVENKLPITAKTKKHKSFIKDRQTNLKENTPKLRAFLLIIWGMNACFNV